MTVVVITGSTRGLGRGLATAFLARGCKVVVSGRRQADADRVAGEVGLASDPDRVLGTACDVTNPREVDSLWQTTADHFGRVDIWVNNAGVAAPRMSFWEQPTEDAKAVIDVNLLGALHGTRTAIRGMLAQGGGRIFNLEGYGSNGMMTTGMAAYGSSKAGVTYLTRSLVLELKNTPVQLRAVSPGMVDTDLLRRDYAGNLAAWNQAKRVLNILADKVETVAPWLADQMLASRRNGGRIAWLTTPKIAWRFATARIRPRRVIA